MKPNQVIVYSVSQKIVIYFKKIIVFHKENCFESSVIEKVFIFQWQIFSINIFKSTLTIMLIDQNLNINAQYYSKIMTKKYFNNFLLEN